MNSVMDSLAFFTLAQGTAHPKSWHELWLGTAKGATEQATQTEWIYMFIMWICIISFVVVMGLMFYFAIKYRRSAQAKNYQTSAAHNTPLELAWSIIPLLVMVPIFYYGFEGYVGNLAAPTDVEEINVTAQKWQWSFLYHNGAQPQDTVQITQTGRQVPWFVVPANRSVRLVMRSTDVIHSFFVPDFRINMDVIPNRYISMWFKADKPGIHTVYCNQYCGDFHSEMLAQMRVVPEKEYEETLKQWSNPLQDGKSIAEIGKKLWLLKGCSACHTLDGSSGTGPTWKNLWGKHEEIDGLPQGVQVDENYLRDSILYSQKQIVKGFPTSMPVFAGQVSDDEVDMLILFIKSLSDNTSPEEKAELNTTLGDLKAKKFDYKTLLKPGGAPAAPAEKK